MFQEKDYWKGRDVQYANELTDEMRANAKIVLEKAELFVQAYEESTGLKHSRAINSGWRPKQVNAATKGAAPLSNHTKCMAIDIGDDDEQLDDFAMSTAGQKALEEIGLWLEHPASTPRWCHVQIVPPRSGNRVFHP